MCEIWRSREEAAGFSSQHEVTRAKIDLASLLGIMSPHPTKLSVQAELTKTSW